MLIVPNVSPVNEPIRAHPWGVTDYEEDGDAGAYVNFVARPDLIPTSLEDFVIHSERPAVQTFYSLLTWVNGPESKFETNDCALRPPVHAVNMFRRSQFIGGRLEFLFRHHAANLNEPSIRWLHNLFCLYAQVTQPANRDATLSAELVSTMYVAPATVEGLGFRLRIAFQAYGNSDDEVWSNLGTMFEGLEIVFRRLSVALGTQLPEFP